MAGGQQICRHAAPHASNADETDLHQRYASCDSVTVSELEGGSGLDQIFGLELSELSGLRPAPFAALRPVSWIAADLVCRLARSIN